jgi:hypothetical protein
MGDGRWLIGAQHIEVMLGVSGRFNLAVPEFAPADDLGVQD